MKQFCNRRVRDFALALRAQKVISLQAFRETGHYNNKLIAEEIENFSLRSTVCSAQEILINFSRAF